MALIGALTEVRAAVAAATFPFALPSAGPARDGAATLVAQLDDYMLPRLRRIDAPMLAVVGGSTGAGKSTLVNSLVRAPVSRAGVLRPTTHAPLLVCHPADSSWFAEQALLPGLERASRAGDHTLQIVNAPLLVAGVALLDAPDIDSVVAANRTLARELLAAGDLWLFVTTAARYADAIPWEVLRGARERGTAVAVVLDRVPPEAHDEIAADFARMLDAKGRGETPLFTVLESTLDAYGLLPEVEVAPLKRWLDGVAGSAAHRRLLTRATLLGAVAAVGARVEDLAVSADQQVAAAASLGGAVRAAYATAMSSVESSLGGGSVLRGEVYSRWQDILTSGELRHALRATTGPRRAQIGAALAERPTPGRRFHAAVARALVGIVVESDVVAARECRQRWRAEPSGQTLLDADPTLGLPWAGFVDAAHDLVHGWQSWLRAVVLGEAPRFRTRSRSYAAAANVLLATIVAVAPALAEITADGVGPTMLRAVLASDASRSIGERARAEFVARVDELLLAEVSRHLAPLSAAGADRELAQRLREASARLDGAQSAFAAGTRDAA